MKTLYFVRHGESEGNSGKFRQTPETPLTEHGRGQAALLAQRCLKLSLELVVSSTMVRAQQTAAIINDRLKLPLVNSDLFCERHHSSANTLLPHDDPNLQASAQKWWANFGNPKYKIDGEETFFELKERGLAAFNFLEQQTANEILVVTHGFFLRVLVATAFLGDDLDAPTCKQLLQHLKHDNVGLTEFKYDDTIDHPVWILQVWNDHAHLADS